MTTTDDADREAPTEPGIYPVIVADEDGSHYTCAQWDGECWRLWCDMFDPPEWDVAQHLSSRIMLWALPGRALAAPSAPTPPEVGDDFHMAYRLKCDAESKEALVQRDAALADAAAMRKALSTVTDAMVDAAQNAFFAEAHEPHGMHDPSAAWEAAIRAAYDAANAKGTG
ncbi:hypothetical protein [Methylibium sp.]|uniref:hypothetical protein n=1 Tax=Methylibium sp. TaxID=2067992 RepID=UPI0017B0BE04|nr:hypothetical protein [Methylibium sp.]MBA3589668.1 hypothetical protein [Methylibium sp.]